MRGSFSATINRRVLGDFPFLLLPLAKQRKIAVRLTEALQHVERARRAAQERLNAAEKLASSYRSQAFGAIHSTETRVFLGSVAFVTGGLQRTPARAPREFFRPYLTVRNVQDSKLDLSKLEKFEITPEELDKYRLIPGDILIVEGNGSPDQIGRNAVFNGEITDCIHQNHIIRVRCKYDKIVPDFLSLYLNSAGGREQIERKSRTSTGLYTLSVAKIQSLEVPLPSVQEQTRLSALLLKAGVASSQLTAASRDALGTIILTPAALLRGAFMQNKSFDA